MELTKKLIHTSIILIFAMVSSGLAQACPCGCGAVGPLVLSPGESAKFQLGLMREMNKGQVDQDGRLGSDYGPEGADSYRVGMAFSFSPRLTISAQGGFERNFHRDFGSNTSAIDPTLGARYTVFSPDMNQRYFPTTQVHMSYKKSLSKGLLENSHKNQLLDIHGNSYSEVLLGTDFWLGVESWTYGLGLGLVYRRPVYVQDDLGVRLHEKGHATKAIVSSGYTWFGLGQLLFALEREAKSIDKISESGIDGSQSLRHTVSVVGNLRVGIQKTLSLTFVSAASAFLNRNTARLESLGMSYIQAI